RPEEDGVYSFEALTEEDFNGWAQGYMNYAITWEVYALDEEFDDAWRFLGQAYQPVISGLDGPIRVALKEGQYIYCVCNYNSFTAEAPAKDDSGTLTISKTPVPLYPATENGYVMPVSFGAEASADLDGDGTLETIYYNVSPAYVEDELWYEAPPESLAVNGVELLDTQGENPFEPYGIWLENPDVGKYYIVDLDKNDGKLELAICDWGSNDWLTTCLFRYEDGSLTYLGHIAGFPDSESTAYHGDGTVSAYARFDVMQTWGGVCTYELKDGQVARSADEFVQPQQYDNWEITLLVPLTVYASPDRSSLSLTLEPSEQPLSFPETDTEHWVLVRCADGSEGWAYFEDFYMVENNGQMVEDTEVFGNLIFAG
ncbi:MAG: hypothetical protein IJ792_05680, partial [Oscillospiraceae bacterium]|nr:hypothetical protein [Oscillospiraceae bacterium]